MTFKTWFFDRDDTGVSTGVRAIIIAIAALTVLSDGLDNGGGSALIAASIFGVGYFWLGVVAARDAGKWGRSRNWAFFWGSMFNLIGLFAVWVYLFIRSKIDDDMDVVE
jgi:hypothetical protein